MFTADFGASKELIEDCESGRPCIELSVPILEKVGGGPGGDAAWITEAMSVQA